MIYKLIKKFNKSVLALFFIFLGFISCYDNGYEEFVPPTGNVNNIQPNTLFTTSTSADNNLSLVFRSYSTDAASYLWDFGDDNTSNEANPDYTYSKGGLYTVKLTTTSSDGLIAVDSSYVAPISVDFNFSSIDTEVTFENLTTGASKLVWNFGDGEIVEWNVEDTEDDADFNPVYIYKSDETVEATLTATNFLGVEVSVSKNIEGLVLSTVPDFDFKARGFDVEFTDSSILAVSHSWDFGDGNTSTDINPTHTFGAEGTYDVVLTTTNAAGVSRSITKTVPVGAVQATFKAMVQNSTCNDWTKETNDNADAWDMTPNSTVKDNDGNTIDSPYRAIWYNSDLADWLASNCGDADEQPGSSGDGNKFGPLAGGGRGVKLNESCRRLYQVVAVEPGVPYTFTIDTRSESVGVNTEVFILNTEITSEDNIMDFADAYYLIDNDYNKDKSSSTKDTFTTSTFNFEATSDKIVIYVRSQNAVDSSNEVFIDNIDIITPGFNSDGSPSGVTATFAAVIQNGTIDDYDPAVNHKDDNNDAWEPVPPSTLKDGSASPYTWSNSALKSSAGVKAAGITTTENSGAHALKFSGPERRAYQPFDVEVGVEYTIKMFVRTETPDDFTIYILNNEVADESDLTGNSDEVYVVSGNDNSYKEYSFSFIATTSTAVFYAVPFSGVSGDSEVYLDDISIETPGF
ncbi:PKD domain-containing protein [uncultured Lutibacter sp.]|uniref:PKD domain-containing protein n=1 Tax=uncultured Lutibacter sp. TaxID=437739 RepID=UPI002604289C|nr:PKD domain-containing protein [uncultured Lutibacter sp.]